MAKKKKSMRRRGAKANAKSTPPSSKLDAKPDADEDAPDSEQSPDSGDEPDAADEKKSVDTKPSEKKSANVSSGDDDDEEEDDDEDDVPAAARSVEKSPDEAAEPGLDRDTAEPGAATWARPLVRLERGWNWFESRLLFVVLMTLLFALAAWVVLVGLSSPLETSNRAGVELRALVGMSLLGMVARLATRNRGLSERVRAVITVVAVVIGAAVAPSWRETGMVYWGQVQNWLQEGSSLAMFGGLRGIATRFTILLALIGASLAAGAGKHINIDVVLRFLKPAIRPWVHVAGALATAAVCFTASWGFFDYISIEGFGADKDLSRGEKWDHVSEELSEDLFILRKQLSLDISAAPDVFGGKDWDDPTRMNGQQWNQFLDEGGFTEHFTKEEIDMVRAPEDSLSEPRVPFVIMPGKTTRGLLVHAMNLMFPIGLIFIGLRVLLRAVLIIAKQAPVEPDPDEFEEHGELDASVVSGDDDADADKDSDSDDDADDGKSDDDDDSDEEESDDEANDEESDEDDKSDDKSKKGGR